MIPGLTGTGSKAAMNPVLWMAAAAMIALVSIGIVVGVMMSGDGGGEGPPKKPTKPIPKPSGRDTSFVVPANFSRFA